MSNAIEKLKELLGPTGFVEGRKASPALGWATLNYNAPVTLRPASTQQVSEVMKICQQAGQKVVPHGGLTGLVGGADCDATELALSLERMNQVEEINTTDRTMTVQAGATLQTVQEAAATQGLHFALDLGARGTASIGGNISTNAGGNQVIRYGMAREQVLGLEVVLPDGRILSSMNQVLKNNAAYDLKHLFIGSEGTLGIITRAVLRLRPQLPIHTTGLVATDAFKNMPKLLNLMGSALAGQMTSFEAMWNNFYSFACSGEHLGAPPLPADYPYYVLIESSGNNQQADAEKFASAMEQALEEGIIVDAVLAKSAKQRESLWAIRDNTDAVSVLAPVKAFDVSVPASRMAHYLGEVERGLKAIFDNPRYVVFGHLGDGNLHLIVSLGEKTPERSRMVEEAVYKPLLPINGSVSAEHGIGVEKKDFLGYSRNPVEIETMKQLKQLFDPKGILNAGKVF